MKNTYYHQLLENNKDWVQAKIDKNPKYFEEPSIIGGSGASSSIKMLSISNPTKAAKTCSEV